MRCSLHSLELRSSPAKAFSCDSNMFDAELLSRASCSTMDAAIHGVCNEVSNGVSLCAINNVRHRCLAFIICLSQAQGYYYLQPYCPRIWIRRLHPSVALMARSATSNMPERPPPPQITGNPPKRSFAKALPDQNICSV